MSDFNVECVITLWDNVWDMQWDLDSHDTGNQQMMRTYMRRFLDVFFASGFFCIVTCIQQLPACKYCSLPKCSGARICGLQMHSRFGDTVLMFICSQSWNYGIIMCYPREEAVKQSELNDVETSLK